MKNMKLSLSLIVGVILTTINVNAKPWKTSSENGLANKNLGFDGLYIGGSFGGEFGHSSTNTFASHLDTTLSNSTKMSNNGMAAGVFTGYGKTVKGIYIGGEIGGELSNASGKDSNTHTTSGTTQISSISIKKTHSMSIAARIGKPLNDKTLVYAKAGLASNNYKLSSSINEIMGVVTISGASSSQNKRIIQPIVGVGAEHVIGNIAPHIQVRAGAEYEHSFGKTMKVDLNSNTFNGSSKFDTSSDAVKARLIFKF